MDEDKMFAFPAVTALCAEPAYRYAREPVLRRMPDGTLMATALSGGAKEPDNTNLVLAVYSRDEGDTWTKPKVLFQHGERAVWATEIFTEGKGPVMFVHTYHEPSFYREIHSFLSRGNNDGSIWSEPESLPNGLGNFSVRQGIVTAGGRWIFPVYWQVAVKGWDWTKNPAVAPDYVTDRWPMRCGVIISDDKGKSFSVHGDLRSKYPLWENNIVQLDDKSLLMLMRAEFAGVLYRSFSYDNGVTWSEPEATDIPNPNAKFSLCKIRNRIVLALNPSKPASKTVFSTRTDLSLWVSDNGMDWNTKIKIAKEGKPAFYPHLLPQDERGMLYMMCEDGLRHYFLKIPYHSFLL